MKKSVMEKWVNALRSGKYKQGHRNLVINDPYGGDKYCCLGVACKIGLTKASRVDERNATVVKSFLPLSVQQELAALNDGDNKYEKYYSFKEIANFIQKNYKKW